MTASWPTHAVLIAVVFASLSACGKRDPLRDVTRHPPSIRGTVTHVQRDSTDRARGTIRIEERPQQTSGDRKAIVTVDRRTLVYLRANNQLAKVSLALLETGSRVDAWFDGPVAESYPVQTGASLIVINSPPLKTKTRKNDATLFRTDSLSYTLREEPAGLRTVIGVTFTNRTADTVYFANCNGTVGVTLEQLTDGAWKPVWSPAMPACLSPSIAVLPGGTRTFPIDVFGGHPRSNTFPQFRTGEIPGLYRAVWMPLSSSPDQFPGGDPLRLEHGVSNTFSLHVQPRPMRP